MTGYVTVTGNAVVSVHLLLPRYTDSLVFLEKNPHARRHLKVFKVACLCGQTPLLLTIRLRRRDITKRWFRTESRTILYVL